MISLTGDGSKAGGLKSIGADEVLSYHDPEWGAAVRHLTQGRGCDLAIDFAAPDGLRNAVAALAPGGVVSLVGGLSGQPAVFAPDALFTKLATIQGIAAGSRKSMRDMLDFIGRAKLRPVIQPIFNLLEARQAFAALGEAGGIGNICISMQSTAKRTGSAQL